MAGRATTTPAGTIERAPKQADVISDLSSLLGEFVMAASLEDREALVEKLNVVGPVIEVLLCLQRREPRTVTDVMRDLVLSRGWASKLVEAAEQARCIERFADPKDRRAVLLKLSPHGRAIVKQISQDRKAVLSEALAPFSEEERMVVLRFVNSLTDAYAPAATRRKRARATFWATGWM